MRPSLKAMLALSSAGCIAGCAFEEGSERADSVTAPTRQVDQPVIRALDGQPPSELFDTKGRRWALQRVHSTWATEPELANPV
jgi:hypothetical protein